MGYLANDECPALFGLLLVVNITGDCPEWPAGNGQNMLADAGPGSGLVGLVTGEASLVIPAAPIQPATCSMLRVGALNSTGTGHTSASDSAAAAYETFAANVPPSYDAAGNMTSDGIYNYTYDAWNRLVKVTRLGPTSSPQVIATYAYDGLGRRYKKHVENSGDRNRTEYFYYDNQWRLLETRNDQDLATRQYVWGTQYIDELICMDVDTNSDGDCTDIGEEGADGRYRFFQDANWNVVAVWDEHGGTTLDKGEHFPGELRERYEYDPYGTCRIFKGWDSAAGCEGLSVIGESLVPGGNAIRYAGYYFDDETGKIHVRTREFDVNTGRWDQRDYLGGYTDGLSLYQYCEDAPLIGTDPTGMAWYDCPKALARLAWEAKNISIHLDANGGDLCPNDGHIDEYQQMMKSMHDAIDGVLKHCGNWPGAAAAASAAAGLLYELVQVVQQMVQECPCP